MARVRLMVDSGQYDRLRNEAQECGVFVNGEEFDQFAEGVLVSRQVSYRVQGEIFNPRHLLLDELEVLIDKLAEMMDDHKRARDERKRQVDAHQGGDGAVPGEQDPVQA